MINRAIVAKTLRDSATMLIACSVGLVAFVILFAWAMLNMGTEVLNFVSQLPWLTTLFEAAFGIRVDGEVSINILFAVCYTHAVVLMLTWTFVIATTTRITAGEVERGTADLLLTLPVRRSEVYLSTSLVWIASIGILSSCPVLGVWLGSLLFETEEVILVSRFVKPAVNFFFLLFAIGGISSFVASLFDRRGPAIGIVVAVVVGSAVLNFVEPFISAIKPLRVAGLLHYFRPVDVVRYNQWPVSSMVALLIFGLAAWLAGLIIFQRKDIPTA